MTVRGGCRIEDPYAAVERHGARIAAQAHGGGEVGEARGVGETHGVRESRKLRMVGGGDGRGQRRGWLQIGGLHHRRRPGQSRGEMGGLPRCSRGRRRLSRGRRRLSRGRRQRRTGRQPTCGCHARADQGRRLEALLQVVVEERRLDDVEEGRRRLLQDLQRQRPLGRQRRRLWKLAWAQGREREGEGRRRGLVRGSIPLLWEQIVDLSYKPRLSIIEHEETPKVVQRHFHDLSQRYGETIVIDLTDKRGDEGDLSNAFAAEMGRIRDVRYVHFDFHHVCHGGNFDNLQVLYNQIEEAIQKQGYFLVNSKGDILLEQSGVVRSNCIDCLDRTNVTQSFLARKSLDSQLQRMGGLSSSESISISDNINDIFKKLWVEHGDELSLEYAGSYALKGDLVRYGRQTLPGLIKDGMSALSRYYLNNFHDGVRQYLPVASAIIVGGITATTFTLSQELQNLIFIVSSYLQLDGMRNTSSHP
nr:unnamed protein product [Digitaria exilis]